MIKFLGIADEEVLIRAECIEAVVARPTCGSNIYLEGRADPIRVRASVMAVREAIGRLELGCEVQGYVEHANHCDGNCTSPPCR